MNTKLVWSRITSLLAIFASSYLVSANTVFSEETDSDFLKQWMHVETPFNVTTSYFDRCTLRIEVNSKTACLTEPSEEEMTSRIKGEVRIIDLESVGSVQIDAVENGSVVTLWPRRTNLISQILYGRIDVKHTHVLHKCDGIESHQNVGIAPSILLRKQMEEGFADTFMSYVRSSCR